jgi:hypothetical protein
MEEVMRKLIILALAVVGVVGFALAKSNHPSAAQRVDTSMPSIEKMTMDAKDMPVQSFVAY